MTTDITLVLDRSGSMDTIREDVIGGFNAFVEEQRKLAGEARLSLVRFDHEYEVVYTGRPLADVVPLDRATYVPRGSTALLDAVGRTIIATGARLAGTLEAARPDRVIIVVQTDGLENASREFTREQVVQLVAHQQHKYAWQFVFLGANLDAIGEAAALGIDPGAALQYQASPDVARGAYAALSDAVSRSRQTGDRLAFTKEDRAQSRGSAAHD